MKKILFIFCLMGLLVSSCSKCSNADSVKEDSVKVALNIDKLVATDKEAMFIDYSNNYKWYETCVRMHDFLDEETTGNTDLVVNIFQSIVKQGEGYDSQVFKFQHFADGTLNVDSINGLWIEDFPLEDSLITISYDSAFVLINKVNFPKPHTKNAILRNPIGPKRVNPQWVFGNLKEQLWVDAVTGDIKTSNPAFEGFLGMPLGEWP